MDEQPKKKIYKRWWFLLSMFFIFSCFALLFWRIVQLQDPLNRKLSHYDTAKSYYLEKDGKVLSSAASSRIELKINGSDQPFQTKAPFSFTLSWKIDPAINLSDCSLDGPMAKYGRAGDLTGYKISPVVYQGEASAENFPTGKVFADKFLKTHEGSLEFKDVMPGEVGGQGGREPAPSSTKVYNDYFSFAYDDNPDWIGNRIGITCYSQYGSKFELETKYVDIQITH